MGTFWLVSRDRIAPTPIFEVSTSTINSCSGSGCRRMGAEMNQVLSSSITWCDSGDQLNRAE